jgi:hypothetical protein
MGHVKMNLEPLWIDPLDYQGELADCVDGLERAGIRASIYNHQLCTLRESLWPFARQSISDWKNVYMPPCEQCGVKAQCGGFFASASLRYSRGIRPLPRATLGTENS